MKGIWIVAGCVGAAVIYGQLSAEKVVGNWEGDSKCVDLVAAPGCHDEHVMFHVLPVKDKPSMLLIKGDRLANQKWIWMGDLDFVVDSKKSTLRCDMKMNGNHSVWDFSVKGDKMTGTLTQLPENKVVRRISVKRVPNSN